MNYDKLNKVLGFSDEGIEKIKDFFYTMSRLKINLSKEEKALCKSQGIDEHLARIIKSHNVCKIRKLPTINDYGNVDFDNPTDGICDFYVMKTADSMDEINRVIYRNKQKYLKKGYNLFYFNYNATHI